MTEVGKIISFGYSSALKTEYRHNPEMRTHVKYGIYGGRLTKDNVTLEHLRPHSKGGSSTLCNFALATKKKNEERANKPLTKALTKEMFERYINQFKGWYAQTFDNKQYIECITKAVQKEGVKL